MCQDGHESAEVRWRTGLQPLSGRHTQRQPPVRASSTELRITMLAREMWQLRPKNKDHMRATRLCVIAMLPLLLVAGDFTATAMAQTAAAATPRISPRSKWRIVTRKDEMNDKPIISAMVDADSPLYATGRAVTPSLIVRCRDTGERWSPSTIPVQPGLEVYIVTGVLADVENAERIHTIEVRFDSQSWHKWGAGESTDRRSPFHSTSDGDPNGDHR